MNSFGLDTVNISFLPSDDGSLTKTLPLVVSPRWETSVKFLCSWLENNRSFLDDMLLKYGAVLVRGFDISSASDFEHAALSFQPALNDCYRGTSPRKLQDGTTYVFSSAEVSPTFPIAQHLEMSFLPAPPRQLFFGCMKAPTSSGGETSLCDFRKVYRELSPELRQKFFDKKMRITRTHKKVVSNSLFSFDVAGMKSWPELFGTTDKAEVEKICKEEGYPIRWQGPNNDTFESTNDSEPFQHHPITKEPCWFNHSQVFHWTTFPAELFLTFLRTWDLRSLFRCVIMSIVCVIKYGLLGHKMSLDCTYGDGTPISVMEMHEIRSAVHKHMVFARWQLGDMLCIDNFAVSHGRQPTYDRNRKIVVAWSDPLEKTNTLTCAQAEIICCCENPQERTPESTLTNGDAQMLKEQVLEKKRPSGILEPHVDLATFMNPHEVDAAFAKKSAVHKRVRSQPVLLLPTSDFWKKAD